MSQKLLVSIVRGRVMVAFPVSELYFLVAKFLSGGPLKETAKVNSQCIYLKYILTTFNHLKTTVFVADFAKRVGECGGKSELTIAGFKAYYCFGRKRTWLGLSNLLKVAEKFVEVFALWQVLPRRLDWEGAEHSQSYDELVSFQSFPAENRVYLRFPTR